MDIHRKLQTNSEGNNITERRIHYTHNRVSHSEVTKRIYAHDRVSAILTMHAETEETHCM